MAWKHRLEHYIVQNVWRHNHLLNKILMPFSWLYRCGHFLNYNLLSKPKRAEIPVVCIGNLISGGSGKTPIALAIAKIAQEMQLYPAFIGHGYKANLLQYSKCIMVDRLMHNAFDVGDEALLLGMVAPTYISNQRALAAEAAKADGADIVIIDDGLQDNRIFKHLSIIVVDAEYQFGNGLLLPAGPLREPIQNALKRADLIIISGTSAEQVNLAREKFLLKYKFINQLSVKLLTSFVQLINLEDLKGKSFVAIIGIAHPKKFLETAARNGLNIKASHIFQDHHLFTSNDLDYIYQQAILLKSQVITSAKDFVRLPKQYLAQTKILEVRAEISDTAVIREKLSALNGSGGGT